MMTMKSAMVAVCLVVTLAVAGASPLRELEAFRGAPLGWSQGEALPSDTLVEMVVAVKQQNTDVLEDTLMRISDPDHAEFNNLLTFDQVNDLVAPSNTAKTAVWEWLAAAGVDVRRAETTPNNDFFSFTVTASQAASLVGSQYYFYNHVSGQTVARLAEPSRVPAFVHAHIDFVAPSVRFPVVQSVRKSSVLQAHNRGLLQFGEVTPSFLRTLYGTTGVTSKAKNNQQSCSSFLGQYYSPSDLQSFFNQFDKEAAGRKPTVIGPNDSGNPGVEASLDIQYIMAMGNGVNTTFWSTAGQQPHNPQNEPYSKWLMNVASDMDAPYTFSVSYGDNEPGVDYDYAKRVNVEFQKAGVRGITIFFASGDGGVSGGQSGPCTTFIPTWPAASPFVTAVGGTTGSNPETAASFSSGGFSNYFTRPSYQDAAVAHYMKVASGLPSKSLFNQTGAGIPDVAAQSENFAVVIGGFPEPVDGTSCASPTFSGVWSLLTDLRLQNGKKPLGWINQIIYKNGDKFNDITQGSNPGCGTNGFNAAQGWDPITGWGTPNYEKLSKLVLSLP